MKSWRLLRARFSAGPDAASSLELMDRAVLVARRLSLMDSIPRGEPRRRLGPDNEQEIVRRVAAFSSAGAARAVSPKAGPASLDG
jgi:hypothetical protein